MLYRPRFLRERPAGAAGRLSLTGYRRSSGPSPVQGPTPKVQWRGREGAERIDDAAPAR